MRAVANPTGKGYTITVQLPGGKIETWGGIPADDLHYVQGLGVWFKGLDGVPHTFVNCPVSIEGE